MKVNATEIKLFQNKIRKFYRKNGRELPFRNIENPYYITVSELMLQQTRVDRVVPKYLEWIIKFPNWKTLSLASNKSILTYWSGLGYNRRALYLKNIAIEISNNFNGIMPDDLKLLQQLPGIGIYTSKAILIFAFKKRLATVDSNIRKVLLSNFKYPPNTPDSTTQQLADIVLPKIKISEWHYALMDYAKTLSSEIHQKYKNKYKQSKFEGSIRQIRGEIIRQLIKNNHITAKDIFLKTKRTEKDIMQALDSLKKDDIISIQTKKVKLL